MLCQPEPMMPRRPDSLNSRIVDCARSAWPLPVSAQQVADAVGGGMSSVLASVLLAQLAKRGDLRRVARGRYAAVDLVAGQDAAPAPAQAAAPLVPDQDPAPPSAQPPGPRLHDVRADLRTASRRKRGVMAEVIDRGLKAPPKRRATLDAPVSLGARVQPTGEATVPTTVVPVRGLGAGYDPRYQCAPGDRPWGAGFAAAGIGRDVTTGKAWGTAAAPEVQR